MITEALFQITEDLARLRAAMKAKGHVAAIATFKVENSGRYCIHLDTEDEPAFRASYGASAHVFPTADNYATALVAAEEFVAGMRLSSAAVRAEEAKAYDAWFDFSQLGAAA